MSRRFAIVLIVFLLHMFLFGGSATAQQIPCYKFTGLKWSTRRVEYAIETSVPPEWVDSIRSAASKWTMASNGGFEFVEVSNSVNRISYENLAETGETVYAGLTEFSGRNGFLESVHTRLNSALPGGWSWADEQESEPDEQESERDEQEPVTGDVETWMLHEFGHWLQLDNVHDSNCSRAVMFESKPLGDIQRELTEDDIEGIRSIY